MRIVMFVANDCRTDARVLREAGSLAAAGHHVTIMAKPSDASARTGDRDQVGGFVVQRVPGPQGWRFFWTWLRYPWRMRPWFVGRFGRALRRVPGGWPQAVALAAAAVATVPWAVLRLPFYLLSRRRTPPRGGSNLDWLVRWRFVVLGWAENAAAAAPVADAWHGHDLTGLEAAGRAWRRHGGVLIYDSHEIFLESGSNATRPRLLKALLARSERRWTRHATALITVNDSLATELGRRLQPRQIVVVHNAPDRWDPPSPAPDLIRASTGISVGSPIALYHGGFSVHRGLEQLAEAILQPGLEAVHAVYLGYGSMRPELEAMAHDPRYGGRLHVLDAVPPSELAPWVASADVGVMAIQPSTLNHRLSTPNKLFESLAAGLPVVVSDFPEMRAIVLDDPGGPVGEVCRPDDPADIARAILAVIGRPAPDAEALRARCLAAAHDRWNWETEVAPLVELYGSTVAGAAVSEREGADPGPIVPQRLTIVLPSTGAFDSRTWRIAGSLAARGHRVTVVARRGDGLADDETTAAGYRVLRVPVDAVDGLPRPLRSRRPVGAWPPRVRGPSRRAVRAGAPVRVLPPPPLGSARGFAAPPPPSGGSVPSP